MNINKGDEVMIKRYCDLCGRILTDNNKTCHEIVIVNGNNEKQPPVRDVCQGCAKKIMDVVEHLQGSNNVF